MNDSVPRSELAPDIGKLVAIYLYILTILSIASMIISPFLGGMCYVDLFGPIFNYYAAQGLRAKNNFWRIATICVYGFLFALLAILVLVAVVGTWARINIRLTLIGGSNVTFGTFLLFAIGGLVMCSIPLLLLLTKTAKEQFVEISRQSEMSNNARARKEASFGNSRAEDNRQFQR